MHLKRCTIVTIVPNRAILIEVMHIKSMILS